MTEAKPQDIYVRAHTVLLEKKKRDGSRQNNEPKWPNYALVFDCESVLAQREMEKRRSPFV